MTKRISWKSDAKIHAISSNYYGNDQRGTMRNFKGNVKGNTKTFLCVNYMADFTENTTLHGLRYIGDRKKPWIERLWWSVMFVLSFVTCVYLTMNVWSKWQNSPVIVSISSKPTPIWKVNFPAITVCSETKSRQTIFNYTKYFHMEYNNLTNEERKYFDAVSLVCLFNETRGNLTTDNSTIEIIEYVAPQMSDMFHSCFWKGVEVNCTNVFSPIMTDDGYCFSFNMLGANEIFRDNVMHLSSHDADSRRKSQGWTLTEGYPDYLPLLTYPRRATGSGTKAGLSITMSARQNDLDFICHGPVQGFKISLHTPAEIPKVSQEFVRIPLNQEILVAVKPDIMTTNENLRAYSIDKLPSFYMKRHCYFSRERYLKYFKVYTKKNCDLECISNYTAFVCGCVSFFMPRDQSIKICSTGSSLCVRKVIDELLTKDIQSELDDSDFMKKQTESEKEAREGRDQIASQCNCLPGCTSFNYNSEISQAEFNWIKMFEAYKQIDSSYKELGMSTTTIFFKETDFFTTVRSELIGFEDFLASCGGLLGLCLGFSIFSLVEIFYFLVWRIFSHIPYKMAQTIYQRILKDRLPNRNTSILITPATMNKN